MSRFLSRRLAKLVPYTPGEQPQDKKYIKLNTNEAPCPPCEGVRDAVGPIADRLRLYSDPESVKLADAIADYYALSRDNVIVTNGSDEALAFSFLAFCDDNTGVRFPDITYGFYPVYADIFNIRADVVPLDESFCVNPDDYKGGGYTVLLANPNAQTGIALEPEQIEDIVRANPDNVVIVDEAYVDFGARSCVPLIKKYDNLLVIQTMSKSRALAGARIGFALGCKQLISDLKTVKYSFNPYNLGTMASEAGAAAIKDKEYFTRQTLEVQKTREYLCSGLEKLGMEYIPSKANFVMAKSPAVSGEKLYSALKERGILVRHFTKERIAQYVRITIGTREQTDILLAALEEITR